MAQKRNHIFKLNRHEFLVKGSFLWPSCLHTPAWVEAKIKKIEAFTGRHFCSENHEAYAEGLVVLEFRSNSARIRIAKFKAARAARERAAWKDLQSRRAEIVPHFCKECGESFWNPTRGYKDDHMIAGFFAHDQALKNHNRIFHP